jgi:hypothetical protein
VFAASVVVGACVWWTHRANVGRLRRGVGSRFGRRGRAAADVAAEAARAPGERRVNERSRR